MSEKLIVEAYILHLIDELDDATEKKIISTFKNAPYKTAREFLLAWESESSIYEDLVQWIEDEWADFQKQNPKKSAKQFAKSKVSDFLASLE